MHTKLPTEKISIKSSPSNAQIFVNCEDITLKTPKTIYLPLGSHLITLKKEGYSDSSFCIEILEGGESIEKSVKLLKLIDEPIGMGEARIESSPSHSTIFVDLEDSGKLTPETVQLSEGAHLITLKREGFEDVSFCVEVIGGGDLIEKYIELSKATGTLTITSKPSYANIWVAEFKDVESHSTKYLTPETLTLNPTPPEEPITVTLKREGFEDLSFDVEIEKGKEIEKFAELVKIEEEVPVPLGKSGIKLVSKPSFASIFIGEEDTGRLTPESIILDPKDYEITLKKEGYQDKTIGLTLEKGKQLEKFIELTKVKEFISAEQSGVKIISKPSSASIYITSVPVPKTPPRPPPCGSYGDLDDDGYVTREDAMVIVRWVWEGAELTDEQKHRADVRGDGVINLENAIIINNYAQGKIDTFPVCPVSEYTGEDIGKITPEFIPLHPGDHEITLKREGYEDKTVSITIEEGRVVEKFIELEGIEEEVPIPFEKTGVKITSKPTSASVYTRSTKTGLREETVIERDENGNPIKVHGFACEFPYEPPEGWAIVSHLLAPPGSHGCCPKCITTELVLSLVSTPALKDTGKITPELIVLNPGTHEITVKKGGYENQTVAVTIEEGEIREKHIELVEIEEVSPDESGIKITSKPTAASIYINGTDTHKITPELIILDPGTHTITLKKEGHKDKTISVTIKEEEVLEKYIELIKVEEPDKSGVRLTSKPTAASIWISGGDIGRITPELVLLDPGTHEITLKKGGYEDRTVAIMIEEGEILEKSVELIKTEAAKSGVRIVSKPSSASVYLNEEDTGKLTPEFLTLDPGDYVIWVKKTGYKTSFLNITIEEGKIIEKSIELIKPEEDNGELYITSKPSSAEVYVQGADTYQITPALLSLAPSTYTITLKKSGYNDIGFNVTVLKGKKIEKFAELPKVEPGPSGDPVGELRIKSKPDLAEIWVGNENTDLLTPETLTLTEGDKTIKLKKSGFDNYSFTFDIIAGEKFEKLCELTKSTGELFIASTPSNARIWIGGEDTHLITPEKFILSPGEKTIKLTYPGFTDVSFTVGIAKGGKLEKFHRFDIPQDAIIDTIYNKTRCMKCDNPPEYDVLFSDGNIRAWLCDVHCKEIVKKSYKEINAIRRIDNGRATTKFRENSNPNVLAEFIREARIVPGGISLDKEEDLAPVHPSGKEIGEKITLDEILPYFKSFYRTKPFVTLIGGICNRGSTTGDLDVFIRSEHRDVATEFRLIRMFPEKYWFRFHFHYPSDQETHPGVFTNHMDIYDEKIEAIHSPEIVLMSVSQKVELFKFAKLLKPAHGHYKGEEYSVDALMEVVNAKPEWYEKGIYVQKKYDGAHVRCDVKRHYESGYDVIIYSEEGNEITKNLPTLRKELGEASKGHAISIVGELEYWEDEKHQSRQQTTAIIHTKEVHPDESKVILNVFDCLYFDKDIHNQPYSERLKSLDKIKDIEHIKKADYKLVDSPTELRKAVEHYSALSGSEGSYLKRSDFPYELDGKSVLNLKYKNTYSIDAKVIEVHKVKDAEAWNYLCVIEDEKGKDVPIGRTYNSSIKVGKGDILKVEFVNLSQYTDPETKKVWFNWWSPRIIIAREDKKKPDNTLTAEKLVVASKGTVVEKVWPKRYEGDSEDDVDDTDNLPGIYLVSPHAEFIASGKKSLIVKSRDFSNQCDKELILCSSGLCFGTLKMKPPREASRKDLDELYPAHRITPEEIEEWWQDTKVFYLYDIYDVHIWDKPRHANIPQGVQTFIKKVELTDGKAEEEAEGYMKSPSEDKKWLGMIQFDSRKKNVGIDFRWQVSDSEIAAFTVFVPKGLSHIPEDPADAKKILTKEILPLVKENIADPLKKFNCQPKNNINATKDVFEEIVGYGPGYDKKRFMWTVDSFEVEHGCKKPNYVELFCKNDFINGRIVFVKIPNKAEWERTPEGTYTWMFFKAKTETPYVLSTRAVKKKWIPPYGASALPRNLRSKIPERYQYWKEKDEKKRLKIRDELVGEIKEKLLKLDAIKKGKSKLLEKV